MDRHGHILSDTTKQAVKLLEPRSLVYHPLQDALLVCDCTAHCVVFLDPASLQLRRQVRMTGLTDPCGIAVMSDGNIVVTGKCGPVGVFNTEGSQMYLWYSYNNTGDKFDWPWYVATDSLDSILVSDKQKIIKMTKRGAFMYASITDGWRHGLSVVGTNLMVAQESPNGDVLAYDLQVGESRPVFTWGRGQEDHQFGEVMSLSTRGDQLVVVGMYGLRMYKLTELPTRHQVAEYVKCFKLKNKTQQTNEM